MRFLDAVTFGCFVLVAWVAILVGWNFLDSRRPWLLDVPGNAALLGMTEKDLRDMDPNSPLGGVLVSHYRMTGLCMLAMGSLQHLVLLIAGRNHMLIGAVSIAWLAWIGGAYLILAPYAVESLHVKPFVFAAGAQVVGTIAFFTKRCLQEAKTVIRKRIEKRDQTKGAAASGQYTDTDVDYNSGGGIKSD